MPCGFKNAQCVSHPLRFHPPSSTSLRRSAPTRPFKIGIVLTVPSFAPFQISTTFLSLRSASLEFCLPPNEVQNQMIHGYSCSRPFPQPIRGHRAQRTTHLDHCQEGRKKRAREPGYALPTSRQTVQPMAGISVEKGCFTKLYANLCTKIPLQRHQLVIFSQIHRIHEFLNAKINGIVSAGGD